MKNPLRIANPVQSLPDKVPPAVRLLAGLVRTVLAALLIGLAVVLGLLSHLGQVQDQTAAESSERQYRALITLMGQQLAVHVRDYTHWDESVEKLASSYDPEWWDENAGGFAIEAFKLSFSMAIDGTDRPRLLATSNEKRISNPPATLLTPSFRALLTEARTRPISADAAEAVAFGVIEFKGRLHLAAASLFMPDKLVNPDPRALLVYALPLHEDILVKAGGLLGSRDLRLLPGPPDSGVFLPLFLADGTRAGFVAWSPPRPGHNITADLIPMVSIAFLLVAALVVFFVHRARHLSFNLYADESARQELSQQNLTILAEKGEELQRQANYDPLTGLPNRNLLNERLSQELKQARRNDVTAGLLFLDLDRFKEVNDTLGHETGDLMLRQVAERLAACVRDSDTVVRLGGDEFVILLPHLHQANDAALIAEKVIAALAKPFDLDGHEVWSRVSIGITIFPCDGTTPGELLRNADLAMYRAKESGGNNCRFYDLAMSEQAMERRTLEMDLRCALTNSELVMHYQPIVALGDLRLSHFEALVRWHHPRRGLLDPDNFLPLAEETGLIIALGKWVLDECCRQLAVWRAAGHELSLAINVSGRQVPQGLPPERLSAALAAHGLPPSALILEITETVLFSNSPPVRKWLAAVNELGIRQVLDDFGTGYSSLNYLKHFPLGALKIDRSFIAGLLDDRGDEALVIAILAMVKGLGLQAVAEGVETEEQLDWLRKRGCDYAQGYLFARPAPADELDLATLEDWGEGLPFCLLRLASQNVKPDALVA